MPSKKQIVINLVLNDKTLILKLLFSPIINLLLIPINNFNNYLSVIKIIINKRVNDFSRFSAYRAFNSSWHRAYNLLFKEYGPKGYAYSISAGRPMISLFQITRLSINWYQKGDFILTTLSSLLFLISFSLFAFVDDLHYSILLGVITLIFSSSYFHYSFFESLKYDSIAWAISPLLFLFLIKKWFLLASVTLLFISFTSVSVLIILQPFLIYFLIYNSAFIEFWILIPSYIKLFFKLLPLIFKSQQINSTLSGIGFSKKGKKIRSLNFEWHFWGIFILDTLYFIVWCIQFSPEANYPINPIIGIVILIVMHIINIRFVRFADIQSIMMLKLLVYSILSLYSADIYILCAYFIAISPLPLLLGYAGGSQLEYMYKIPKLEPFYLKNIEQSIKTFLAPIKKPNRVLFVFNFKNKTYPDYDGFRALIQLIHYEAIKKDTNIFPDFYAFFDSYSGTFNLDKIVNSNQPKDCIRTAKLIGCKNLILPSKSNKLSDKWINFGFEINSSINLKIISELDSFGSKCIPGGINYLHLISNKETLKNEMVLNAIIITMKSNEMELEITNLNLPVYLLFIYDDGWKITNDNQAKILTDNELGFMKIISCTKKTIHLKYS